MKRISVSNASLRFFLQNEVIKNSQFTELKKIKNELVKIDEDNQNLSLSEIEKMWETFSGDNFVNFYEFSQKNFQEFVEWMTYELKLND